MICAVLLCRCVVYSIENKYYLPFVCCTIFFFHVFIHFVYYAAERETHDDTLETLTLARRARSSARYVHARTHVRMHHRARER